MTAWPASKRSFSHPLTASTERVRLHPLIACQGPGLLTTEELAARASRMVKWRGRSLAGEIHG